MMFQKPFGLAIRAVILNKNGRCLLLRRSSNNKTNVEKWEFPGGKIEPNENFTEALHREVAEEVGSKISIGRAVGFAWTELPKVNVVQIIMEARLKSGKVRLSQEHDDYAWVNHKELSKFDLLEDFKPFARMYSRLSEKRAKLLIKNREKGK
jgi:mutator protein MutT